MKVLFASVAAALLLSGVALAADGSISLDQPAPALGDTITFTTSVPKLKGYEYPMVDVQCYQDVDGDGSVSTELLGPDIVFSSLTHPGEPVLLGGYVSIWTLRGGGPAECRAELAAYGWRGGVQSIRVLAATGFLVAG